MTQEIIHNLTRKNHFWRLLKSFDQATEIVIVSPFLSPTLDFFPFKKLTHLRQLTLVTTLKPKESDQFSKIPFFKNLFDLCNHQNIELSILIENSLHGKVYISKQNNISLEAIITSANFTNNGLRLNNEWGTVITSPDQISKLEDGILSKVIFKPLTELDINNFTKIISESTKDESETSSTKLNLAKDIELKENPFSIGKKQNYWLKPIGVSDDNIPWDRVFDEVDSDLHFSKIKPTGVKKGDIIITYAVGHLNVLSIYKVTSKVHETEIKNDRWPYYVVGENLTPHYGQNWNSQGITITDLRKDVIKKGVFNVTPSGKNSFGSLMQGADKLRLTPEFGQFLISKIARLNNDIKNNANTT